MRKRRTVRWVLVVAVLLAVLWGMYSLLARLAEFGPLEANQLLLSALSLGLVILTLGLAGVLIRNLVKLIVERKRGMLGSKLRTKLVFFFLALVLLPSIILFSGSAQVINMTVEGILRSPREKLSSVRSTVAEWRNHFTVQSLARGRSVSDRIRRESALELAGSGDLARWLDQARAGEDLQLIWLFDGSEWIAGSSVAFEEGVSEKIETQVRPLVDRAVRDRREFGRVLRVAGELRAVAVIPFESSASPGGRSITIVVDQLIPPEITQTMRQLDSADQDYRDFRDKRRELVQFYVTLIGLIFLATLFVATWLGFYLSRRITVPIQELAAATREISAGNLNVRVETRVGDEMGTLVDAFNDMAAELHESREVITRSTADLRRTNQALDERRRYIETLVANLSTAVFSLDPQGQVTTVNPAVHRILNVQLSPGDDACSVLTHEQLEQLAELIETVRSEGRSTRRDLELPVRESPLRVSVQCSSLRGRSGEDLGILVMVEDLSDLLQAQKAQAWREVARRIAHEIKNPLTPIQLSAQRLRKKFLVGADDLDKVLLESTDSIEREVGALKQLVDEFSEFARMPEVAQESVDFRTVVESVLSLYQGLPGVRWEVELDPAIGHVRIDGQQIRRVLINLIDNAVAALNDSGTIRISANPAGRDGGLRIEVADSGPGIPPADRAKMFVPYFSTKKRGTGLGLAIVHKVVTDHRGTIRIEDNVPSGARFVIEIPA